MSERSERRAAGMIWLGAVLAVLTVVAGCQIGAAAKLEPVGEARVDVDHAACIKRGGDYRQIGGAGYFCLETTKDAGKSCSSANQCESACLARSQSCAPLKPLFGCNEILTGSGVAVTQCIE